jgi:hypothetical protein
VHKRTLSAFFLAAFFGAAADGRSEERDWMRVELDIFSGRTNPEWTLTDTEATELKTMAAALPVAAASPPPFDGLGYRGIVVRDPVDPYWSLVAFRDIVWIRTLEGSEVRSDPDAGIERWLLGAAGDAVNPALLERLGY